MKYLATGVVLALLGLGCGDETDDILNAPGDTGPSDIGSGSDAGLTADAGRLRPTMNLLELAESEGLIAFINTATTAGLREALAGGGQLTVLAPDNQAFDRFALDAPSDPALVTNILLGHVMTATLTQAELRRRSPIRTVANTFIAVTGNTAGGARFADRVDLEATNGRLHVMQDVLRSVTVGDVGRVRPDLSRFAAVVSRASTLAQDPLFGAGPITVFAPSDTALPGTGPSDADRFLATHTVDGQLLASRLRRGTRIRLRNGGIARIEAGGTGFELVTDRSRARLRDTDIRLANGVVHVIEGILETTPERQDILRTLRNEGLTSLADALLQTGLDRTLSGRGPFTVFAPTNGALASAGAAAFPAAPALQANVLLNHVVARRLTVVDLDQTRAVTSLANRPLRIERGPRVDGINISARRDIEATNGIIHVVDQILPVPGVVDTLRNTPSLSELFALANGLGRPGFAPFVARDGITLLAPTNAALQAVDTSTLTDAQRITLIEGHVIVGARTLMELPQSRLRTRSGEAVLVQPGRGGAFVLRGGNGVIANFLVTESNVRLRDGTLHRIDGVIPSSR